MTPDSDRSHMAISSPASPSSLERHRTRGAIGQERLVHALSLVTSVVLLLASAFISTSQLPAYAQGVDLIVVNVETVAQGYRTSKLRGSEVMNDQKERIGKIDDLIIDRERVLFAVLQVGGFLGVGGQLVVVPFESLQLDEAGSTITLPGGTKEQLKKLPAFRYES